MGEDGARGRAELVAVVALEAAIEHSDGRVARRALARLVDGVGATDALDQLARIAAAGGGLGPGLAVELLVEMVDDMGVARSAVQRIILDEAAVDDVTQDTLISVAQSIGLFRGEARFTTWLHHIARNRAVDHLRRQRSTVPLSGEAQGLAVHMSSLVASHDAVQDLLSRLPHPYGEVVRMRDVDKMSYEEMVVALERNLNTVRSQVARGRAMLAGILEREGQP